MRPWQHILGHIYYPQWVWHMTPTCLFPCLPWVMYVDTGVLRIHIRGISFQVVCLTVRQAWGSGLGEASWGWAGAGRGAEAAGV